MRFRVAGKTDREIIAEKYERKIFLFGRSSFDIFEGRPGVILCTAGLGQLEVDGTAKTVGDIREFEIAKQKKYKF